jgi:tripartite-type tricarboxylate transporter receptor subunit TctC
MRKPLCVAGALALLAHALVAVARPEVQDQLSKQAFEARSSSAAELVAYLREQLDVWGKAIRDAGIQPE